MKSRFIIAILFFLVTYFSGNTQTIITDRPDQTESSSTVNKGSLQIESGILLAFNEDDLISERQILAPTTLFRYGISKVLEIRVLSQFESLKDQNTSQKINGISDLEIGTKIQLFKKENVNTEIAFLSHVILPTGSKSLTNDAFGTINKLSISHELNNTMGLGYNVGYDYFGKGNGDLTYSVALGISITEIFSFYIEPYGALLDFNNYESNFDAGITYLIQDNCQLDFSFGTGINHTMNYLSIGCSINIAKANNN
ncbi:Putative MetA-pathway of phenol degradation [Flaviramulus basaltis]|uniref:Putative MetA-pathway of phenol degradation n=1 Tax=Flaviramulus basaltis TaxID=369401 RepID=A0A1K2IBY1_9FLAO|nr:transporter [Flaviramulus basaltis]SFZ89895.1 Putative MetA-pathway of phenol degradation [Flaviramulus basaltis]